jgi:hypothetical protein
VLAVHATHLIVQTAALMLIDASLMLIDDIFFDWLLAYILPYSTYE